MENIFTIIIAAVVLIVSSLINSRKKKVELDGRAEEKDPVPPFSFYEEEDLNNPFEKIKENSVLNQKTYFTYDNSIGNEVKENIGPLENNKGEDVENEKEEFDLKKAIIYSEILNRPYN